MLNRNYFGSHVKLPYIRTDGKYLPVGLRLCLE